MSESQSNSVSYVLSLTHNSSQDFSGTGSAIPTEILGIYSFSISLEQL